MASSPRGPSKGNEFLDRFDAATSDLEQLALVDLQGETPAPDPGVAASSGGHDPDPGARSLDTGHANLEIALDRDASGQARPPKTPARPAPPPAVVHVPADVEDLQLDFGAAGLSGPVRGQSAPGPADSQAAARVVATPVPSVSSSTRSRVGLFGSDRVAGFLIGGALGLLLGIYPALRSAEGRLEDATEEHFAELENAVDRPLAVRAGELRTPEQIAGEIEREYPSTRSRFWMVWLGVAVPVGLVLGSIRRRA